MDPAVAASLTAELLGSDVEAIHSAAAAWLPGGIAGNPSVAAWLRALPTAVAHGPIPTQAAADAWAREHSLGLIPIMPPVAGADLVLATVLASKVTWSRAFDLTTDATAARGGPWEGQLSRLLQSNTSHAVCISDTRQAGRVGVHVAGSGEGLLVLSVDRRAGRALGRRRRGRLRAERAAA